MSLLFLVITGLALLVVELLYIKTARVYGIVDRPNLRSSHTETTIRGGGVVVIAAVLIASLWSRFPWPLFFLGLMLVATVSFLDDLKSLAASYRFIAQIVGLILIFYQIPTLHCSVALVAAAFVVSVGSLNAFNFMDGINGMTGVYSLVTLGSFFYIQRSLVKFTDEVLIVCVTLSALIFLFFNFRKRAVCFAGDVGSVSFAFVEIFFLLQLVSKTGNLYWVLVFLVYGIDSIVTILFRLFRRENIFTSHRTHLYQHLVNERGLSHRAVAVGYGTIQLIVNIVLFFLVGSQIQDVLLLVSALLLGVYVWIRYATSHRPKTI